jgi:hypothetical protein
VLDPKNGRPYSWRLWLLLPVSIFLACIACDDEPPLDRAFERHEHAAAMRGVAYLIRNSADMAPPWRLSIFGGLYKLAPDERLAARSRALVEETLREPIAEIPEDFASTDWARPRVLRPVLLELWRRRLTGAPWRPQATALGAAFAAREDRFWASLSPARQLVFIDMLERVGIGAKRSREDVRADLLDRWAKGDQEALLLDTGFIVGVTHIFYSGSRYFERWLDPADHVTEIEIFDRAMLRYLERFPSDPFFVDLAGEILTSRRLLRLEHSKTSRAFSRLLQGRQNPNGSWRRPGGNRDHHSTYAAVSALISLPGSFRPLEEGSFAPAR